MKHADIYITHNMTNLRAGYVAYVYVISTDTAKGKATCGEFGIEDRLPMQICGAAYQILCKGI